jgi:hypothetical protein
MPLHSSPSEVSDSSKPYQMENTNHTNGSVSSTKRTAEEESPTKGSSPTSVAQFKGDNSNSSSSENTLLKNQYATEIVKSLFGSLVGTIYYHCPCHHPSRHMSGKLYVGTNALAFYSNLFGIERKLLLDYAHVSTVNEYRTTSIAISYKDQEYKFRALPHRSDALAVLKRLILDATGRDCVALVMSSAQPMPADFKRSKIEGSRNKFRTKNFKLQGDQFPSRRRSRINSADVYPNTKPSLLNHRQRSHSTGTLAELVGSNSSTQEHSIAISRVDSTDSNLGDNLTGDILGFLGYTPLLNNLDDDTNYIGDTLPSTKNHRASLDSFYCMKNETKETFKNILFHDHCISNQCKVDTFYEIFFSDTAAHPIEHYQRQVIGDSEVRSTPWTMIVSDCDTCYTTMERLITFRHKVSAPVGPPTARATKHQRCYMFGTHAFIIETQTTLKDVPNSDCFRVEDRIVVEQFNDEAIRITIGVQVLFMKNTIWKKLIERMTRTESEAWFQGYVQMLIDALDGTTCLTNPDIDNDGMNVISVVPKADTPPTTVISEIDCKEIRRPVNNNSTTILKTLTTWMNLFVSTTTEIRAIHLLLVIISLIVLKLCLDISFLRREFSVMQHIFIGEVEALHEEISEMKGQLEVYKSC